MNWTIDNAIRKAEKTNLDNNIIIMNYSKPALYIILTLLVICIIGIIIYITYNNIYSIKSTFISKETFDSTATQPVGSAANLVSNAVGINPPTIIDPTTNINLTDVINNNLTPELKKFNDYIIQDSNDEKIVATNLLNVNDEIDTINNTTIPDLISYKKLVSLESSGVYNTNSTAVTVNINGKNDTFYINRCPAGNYVCGIRYLDNMNDPSNNIQPYCCSFK